MTLPSENELRKAWLKKRFASWEYHEEMLKLHARWLAFIKQALAKPEIRRDHPDDYKFFTDVAIPNFEKCPKPGEIKKYEWETNRTAGWASEISYYSIGIDDSNWNWMSPEELKALGEIEGPMRQMAQNIIYTVDDMWFYEDDGNDDSLLDEEYTGPIDWPPDWKEEILAELGLKDTKKWRALPGEASPKSGYWLIWHAPESRRYVNAGEALPDYVASRGAVIWSYDTDQSDRPPT